MADLILRTVYLSADVDKSLRELAFRRGVSKNEVIREMIRTGLESVAMELKGAPTREMEAVS